MKLLAVLEAPIYGVAATVNGFTAGWFVGQGDAGGWIHAAAAALLIVALGFVAARGRA